MPRNKAIDILRGLGILSIIIIHVTAWYTSEPIARLIWNWGQFAVPAFVFCSTYLFFQKKEKYEKEGFVNYSITRLKRLMYPFWIFLAFYYLIFLYKNPASIDWVDIVRNATLTTAGREVNWAVLLFVMLTVLMFPLVNLWRKSRLIFLGYAVLAVAAAFLFMKIDWPYNYRLIMWLPWSLVILFSWYFARFENVKKFFKVTLSSLFILFIFFYILKGNVGGSMLFIDNKYPPNIYYLTYGMLASSLIYYLAAKGLFDWAYKPIHYLSVNSYNIYFIHLWLIIAFTNLLDIKSVAWWQLLIGVTILTVVIQKTFALIASRR